MMLGMMDDLLSNNKKVGAAINSNDKEYINFSSVSMNEGDVMQVL